MIESNRWILAVIALASGLLIGEIAGRILRGSMSRDDRSDEVKEMARPVSSFVFWAATAFGVLVAVASTSKGAFEAIPERATRALPNLLLSGLILIGGYAVAIAATAALSQSAVRTSGTRHRGLERAVRWAILGTTAVLSLSQLGVNTNVLTIALGIVVGLPCLAVVMLTALGGRYVARDLAAGRALRSHVKAGFHLTCGDVEGLIVAVHPVSVEVETIDGRRVHLPLHRLLDEPYSVAPARALT